MNASDLAAERQRNRVSRETLERIQAQPRKPMKRRTAVYLEPLVEGEIGERELTMRGMRGWGKMKAHSTIHNTNEDDWRKER